MNCQDITKKWAEKTLTDEDIYWYLCTNIRAGDFHLDDTIWHVAYCLHGIYLWATGQVEHLGSFGHAIARDSLTGAAHLADEKNRTALWLYPAFLYSCAPSRWRKGPT